MLTVACAAQVQQFIYAPAVDLTGGRVTSFLTGTLQAQTKGPDILYINASALIANSHGVPVPTIVAGEELNSGNGQSEDLGQNHIPFTNVSHVVAALGDFNGDHITDYTFALSPLPGGLSTLCIYYGTGAAYNSQSSSYDGGVPANVYPPISGKSGCMTFSTQGANTPNFTAIAAFPFNAAGLTDVIVEDSANNELYIFANNGTTGYTLPGISILSPISLSAVDGPGPLYIGDFNGDGNIDFIVNGQTSHSATVYLGNGDGTFKAPVTYNFGGHIYSMLMQKMEGDTQPSMVVEGDSGVISIHRGKPDGTFVLASEGGTSGSTSAFAGNGGQLAAIGDVNHDGVLDILTTTPVGLSVLVGQGNLSYTLKGIYNIGPGRASFALADIFNSGNLAFVVDAPEGVALVQGDGLGGFQTSNAYSALAPALSAAVGQFRTSSNPKGNVDVVVSTAAANPVQGQLLQGNGDGTFTTPASTTNTTTGPSNVPAGVWSYIQPGDFDGDGNLDILYSLIGLPQPAVSGNFPILYTQYGNGDGTFAQSGFAFNVSGGSGGNLNGYYPESVVGDFNGDGTSDVAISNAFLDGTMLGIKGVRNAYGAGLSQPNSSNTNFSQVASGYFKAGGSGQQDLVFQQGTSLIPYVNRRDSTGKNFIPMTALTGPSPSASYAVTSVLLTDVTDNNGIGNGDIIALYQNLNAADLSNPDPSTPNWLYIWIGNGDGTFQAPVKIKLSRNFYLAAVTDMNGDGQPDIVLSDGYLVAILYNQGSGSFASDWAACGAVSNGGCKEQHFLAGQGINSLSVQNVRGSSRPDLVVANGGLTISNPVVLGNMGASSLSLTPNPVVNTGGITVLLNNVTSLPTTGSLTPNPEPSTFGAPFTITAALTSTAGIAPTGLVAFYLDGTLLGSAVLNPTGASTASAVYSVPTGNTYAGGPHTLMANFPGDLNNSPKNLSVQHQILNAATTTTLDLCVGPTAQCPSTGPVTPPPYSTLSMVYGQTYNGIAQVSPSGTSPLLGDVAFYDVYNGVTQTLCMTGINIQCPASVGTGTQVGINVLTAAYVPLTDPINGASTSPPVTLTVTPDTPTVTISSSLNPAPQGQAVTLTATLAGPNAPLGTAASPVGLYVPPLGPVVFMDGSTVLCTSQLGIGSSGVSSTATCITSTLPSGTNTITVSYAATLDFNGATSAPFTETINALIPPSFTISVTPNPVSEGVGNAAALTVTVTGQNGFADGVNLSCGNLPNEATCFFAQTAIAVGGGSSPLLVEGTAPHNCGSNVPYFTSINGGGPNLAPFTLPALAGLAVFFLPGRRRWLRAWMALILVAAVAQITGCGTCTDLGTKPGTYTFQVIGTSIGTGQVQSQAVTLTITI